AGEADFSQKVALLRGARAVLCPIEWEEPFGLIAIEAMLAGTPLIGFPRGSFPEIVDEGITGTLVRNVEEMAKEIRRVEKWDRARCSKRACERFSSDRMAIDYESLFVVLLRRRSSPAIVTSATPPGFSRMSG